MLDAQDKSAAFLESCVKKFKIFIDTCSLLSDQADIFWRNITPILQREHKAIIVPFRVYEEVKKFSDNPMLCVQKGNPELNQRAKATLNNIAALQRAGIIEVFGDKNDNFADNVFQTVFTQFRLKYNLMLITQDRNLASDILAIGKSKAVNTENRILVERINKYGYLSLANVSEVRSPAEKHSHSGYTPNQQMEIPAYECFARAASVRKVSGKMSVSSIPGEGSTLTAERNGNRKLLRLVSAGPSGGEGTIYTTSIPGIVAKIYKPEKLNRAKFEKLSLMMTKSINCEGVCFPLALLYNDKNEFVGYLMNKAEGKELQRCVFIPQLLKKNFPGWTKVDTTTLCVTILRKLKYLHERNVILGDINPNNILVVSPSQVYFVDTDSYQIEGFPCPVGTINYTAPEIQRKEYSSFLRTLGNEYFAVATLLFMIMLPGKPPYSLQGGENQIDNIINGDFAYASGSRSTGKAPEGMWRFCWSHLPRYLKDDFYETFRKGGEHSTEATRYSTEDWLQKFEYYLDLLKSGKLASQDSMSLDIFPSRLKKNPKATYIRCKLCGNEVDEERTEQGICQSCLKKGEIYHCAKCGCEMIYTNYQKYIRRIPRYEVCKDCLNNKNMVYVTVRCEQCGRSFEITNGEKEFYDKKGFQLPKRCKECRGHRAYAPNSGYSSRSSRSPSYDSSDYLLDYDFSDLDSSVFISPDEDIPDFSDDDFSDDDFSDDDFSEPGESNNRCCFITTAACEYFGKPDDCYELTMLRQFRDGWLAVQPGGEELIREYYRIAPSIVDDLNVSEERDTIYQDIWNQYILPCVRLIEQNDYKACCALYEKMVRNLKNILKEK